MGHSSQATWKKVLQQIALVAIGLIILMTDPLSPQDTAAAVTKGKRDRISDALEVLRRVPSGKVLLERALEHWEMASFSELLTLFSWGSASKTDAVLTRHFNPKTGREQRERRVTIFLRNDQSLQDLVLDIAHELTHATAKPDWDPYDPYLTPASYIWNAIEGGGGEVDALVAECQVGMELASRYGVSADRCKRYRGASEDSLHPVIERQKVVRDFYRVGNWHEDLTRALGTDLTLFPMLSDDKPELYSSTGHAPYPVALLQEYDDITRIACTNSKKRLDSLPERNLASGDPLRKSIHLFLERRCRKPQVAAR